MKCIDNKLKTLQDKAIVSPWENFIRGGIGSVMGGRYVISDWKKVLYCDANNLYGHSMTQPLMKLNLIELLS